MEIYNEIISIIVSNGVFAILFVILFCYQLKDGRQREEKYQNTIEELTSHLQILEDVKQDLSDIKNYLQNEDEYEKLL